MESVQTSVYRAILLMGLEFNRMRGFICLWHWFLIDFNVFFKIVCIADFLRTVIRAYFVRNFIKVNFLYCRVPSSGNDENGLDRLRRYQTRIVF